MGAGWDAAMDQKLLVVALHVKSLDAKDICGGWTSVFTSENLPAPIYWAVYKRLLRLKKSTGGLERSSKVHKAKPSRKGAKKAAKPKRKSQDEESNATETDSEFQADD
ncbi:hypothetical protein M409DRAFT_53152 [Zasmidium cellare ATCC 36951]|uniref:Uncharacterized protein n=1 Tax=Zasmidium cellare ATCC 36951 TaxID=1080233 RepID=A0A6A6CP94_ZASCE|nr:uncharacterized protein M409DRAFT_53152 [Zasmidium cellare ATCC 36951]KAF2168483.1 hypothetical protein M409DRAFT_53152 [Zasmidium cellare ATCC 36951]